MFTTGKKEKQVAVESKPEELSPIFGLEMVASEPAEGEDVKTDAEKIFGSVINRLKMENSGQLKKLEVEQAILDIMREKPKAKNQIQRNAEDLVKLFGLYLCITVFFTQANGSMISKNQFAHYFESLDRMKRTCWPIHIHNYLMKSIRKHIHTPLSVSGCVIYMLYWFAEHNKSMTPCSKESMPRMVRWIVCDISTTIESNLNDAMKKMEPEWIEGYRDQEKIILEEYQKKREANSSETLKQNLRISEMQKEKLHEELTKLQIKHKKLVTFIDKQSRYVNELNIKDLPDDEVNHQCIDTLSRIFKFTKELQREYDDENDEEIDEQKDIEGEYEGDEEEDEDNNDGEHEDKADELNEWNDNESEKAIINPSTPLSNTNGNPEDQEDQMHNDNQDVMITTETVDESFDSALITLAEAILQLNPEAMFPLEENMLLLTQGEDSEKASEIAKQEIDDILENLSESVFVKLKKGCYKMAPELKQKVATIITECPTWSFGLSQDYPTEDSSQTSLSDKDVQHQIIAEALQFIQEHQSDFFSNQENEKDKSEKTPKKKRARKMLGGEILKRKAASKLSRQR